MRRRKLLYAMSFKLITSERVYAGSVEVTTHPSLVINEYNKTTDNIMLLLGWKEIGEGYTNDDQLWAEIMKEIMQDINNLK